MPPCRADEVHPLAVFDKNLTRLRSKTRDCCGVVRSLKGKQSPFILHNALALQQTCSGGQTTDTVSVPFSPFLAIPSRGSLSEVLFVSFLETGIGCGIKGVERKILLTIPAPL
jgi:hypothetical protein